MTGPTCPPLITDFGACLVHPTAATEAARGTAHSRLRARHRGFTTIELMTVVSVIAVLLGIAAPSLQTEIQKARIASEVSTFMTDLKFTRSEAMKTGAPVTMCPSSDGASCLGSSAWQRGWIVFYDVNSSGVYNAAAGNTLVRARAAWAAGDTFTPSTNLAALTYGRLGFASNLPAAGNLLVAHASTASTFTTQCVKLNPAGVPTLQTAGTGQCS